MARIKVLSEVGFIIYSCPCPFDVFERRAPVGSFVGLQHPKP